MKSAATFWILVGAALLITGTYALIGWVPEHRDIEKLQAAIAQSDAGINESIQNIRHIPDMRLQCREGKRRVEDLQRRILPPDSISPAMRGLNDLADQYQIRVERISFSTDSLLAGMRDAQAAQASSFELPLWLTFSGQFLDFGMMLEHLGELPYAIRFTDFKIVREEHADTLTFDILARVRIQRRSAAPKLAGLP